VLTGEGRALLPEARAVAGEIDRFKAHAHRLAGGLEPELSAVIDVMFPIQAVTCAVVDFQAAFANTPLRLQVEALGAVIEPVLDGRCAFGVMGSLALAPPQITRERLLGVRLCMTAAPGHPLAVYGRPIPATVLAEHVQLVLSDRSALSKGQDFGVFSPRTWRLADLGAKHAFLRAGLGWGGLPRSLAEPDIEAGLLVELQIEDAPGEVVMPMSAFYRTDAPPGPAGRWLIKRLKAQAELCIERAPGIA
jgi:DNA-binding transcriptional LysR family regulator